MFAEHTSVRLTSRLGGPYIAQMEAFRYPGFPQSLPWGGRHNQLS